LKPKEKSLKIQTFQTNWRRSPSRLLPLERKHDEIIDKAMKEQEKHKEIEKENSDGEKQKETNEEFRIKMKEAWKGRENNRIKVKKRITQDNFKSKET
jgi:ribosomal protein L14E/L6E/L27E